VADAQPAALLAKGKRPAANRIEAAIQKPDPDARKVDVKVNDRGVQMPTNLPAGKTAFVVKNTGKEAHNFEIEGNAIEKSFWISLPPNETKTMQVELKPGTYEADCRVKGHERKEAKTRLVVK
jgi:iron uptake system EfeUOB component EfeO/EfeM